MFKEAVIILLVFVILYVILRLLLRKKPQAFRIAALTLLVGSILLNSYYNLKTFFPDFVLDGHVPLGDSSENLFLYKADSQYPCEIIFPVLQGRTVRIDDSSDYYDLFLSTFSKETSSITLSDVDRETVLSKASDFPSISTMHLIDMMNYAFKTEADFTELPLLYVQTEALTGDDTLIAVIDEGYNLYLMSETYFSELTGSKLAAQEVTPYEA